ncbi:hypothetical protein Prum_016930 [Phytohabitans rumicis]|uniref:Serine/threonine protein kinase n=1 Tax=Phytohabitans rumicis TaxID=1076125 RepID=A0A6V8KZX3_9ACTN|nr:hypothetical protein Prum_016930 [Phytohabitans rumicis]
MLALLVALGSLMAAWRAVDQAADAKQFALAGGSGTAPGATQPLPVSAAPPSDAAPADAAPTDAPVDPGTPSGTGAPPLDERTVYTVKYDSETLTLKTTNCSDQMYADLDEPRANVGSAGADLVLNTSCSGPSFLKLWSGVEGSTSASPGRTPHDCAEAIRTSPLGEAPVPARKGTAICLTTSFEAAQERGDNQRLVLVEITGVADDGAVTIRSRAWNIPR